MLKSRRLTSLLSQSLTTIVPPIDTFTPSCPSTNADQLVNPATSSLSHPHVHTPRIVMAILLTASGNLLAASTLNVSNAVTSHSLALSPSISQSTLGVGENGPSSIRSTNSAIHLADLSPKPRVYASYSANAWRSYVKAIENGELFEDDREVDWIAVENEVRFFLFNCFRKSFILILISRNRQS